MDNNAKKNRILAFETTGMTASVAFAEFELGNPDSPMWMEKKSTEQRNHLTELMPMISEILKYAGTSLSEIDAIAVSAGPGSFTGMRIGISTARALAQVKNIPIIKVPTLETFAFETEGIVCPIFDARLSQLYAGVYALSNIAKPHESCENMMDTLLEGGAYTPDEYFAKLSEILKERVQLLDCKSPNTANQRLRITFYGDGIEVFKGQISEWIAGVSMLDEFNYVDLEFDKLISQRALNVAKWAHSFGTLQDFSDLEPIYCRKAEAQRRLDEGLLKPKA